MNIKGLLKIIQEGLPIGRSTILIRNLNEIPRGFMNAYGNEPRWAMRGFDEASTDITDHPYDIKESRAVHGFTRNQLRSMFRRVNADLDKKGCQKTGRLYLVCEVFTDEDVDFSGFGLRNKEAIYIDVKQGNRPSRRDWDPDASYVIPVERERPRLYAIPDSSRYRESAIRVCKDLMKFPPVTQLDFTCLKDGHFLYHDMFQLNRNYYPVHASA